MADKPRLDTTRLQKMAQAYWESAALMAAVELEIFTAIAHGQDTIPAVAKAVGISERNAERLLTALVAMTLLTREGERFANAPDVQRFLVKDSDRYAGPWILFTKPRWTAYGELSRAAAQPRRRTGSAPTRASPSTMRGATTPPPTRSAWAPPACSAAASISRGRKLMLDLGGGSGAYSIVATETFPGLKAIVLDLPPVAVVARRVHRRQQRGRPRQRPGRRLHDAARSRRASTSW